MKLVPAALCAAGFMFATPELSAQQMTPRAEPVQHRSVIADFKTGGGKTLPEAVVVYGTYGALNAAKDNARARRSIPPSCSW